MIRVVLSLALVLVLAACGYSGPRFHEYHGPEVTMVRVYKDERRLELWHHDTLLRSFDIGLGFAPEGHKEQEGDGRTPEGIYFIDRRNPQSRFHLSLGISYPNEVDVSRAQELGVSPGGDIFIHGRGPEQRRSRGDWTAGCIAVSDREMEEIYAMVRTGTPIEILP